MTLGLAIVIVIVVAIIIGGAVAIVGAATNSTYARNIGSGNVSPRDIAEIKSELAEIKENLASINTLLREVQ